MEHKMKRFLTIFVLIDMMFFYGCAAVGPDYIRPDVSVSKDWLAAPPLEQEKQQANPRRLAAWWQAFNDPQLTGLMERAMAGNRDLKKAQARLREARARRGISEAGFYPTVDASARANRTRTERKTGADTTSSLYSAGFDAAWELDIFGGVRRSVEAADADIEAVGEDLNNVLVSLLAEAALSYFDVRIYQARLTAAQASLAAQEEAALLVKWRSEAGLEDELALKQSIYTLESSRAQIPNMETGIEEAKNRLAILLGEQPGALHTVLKEPKPIPVALIETAVGTPADILRQRPDIRKAERQLAAQTARIGVAQADYYPRFTLSGSIGIETLSLKNASDGGVLSLGLGPRVSWRIFDAGAVRRNVEVQSALQEEYLIAYEAAVYSALEEVENSLVAYAQEHQRRKSLLLAIEAAREAADLAGQKYASGLADFSQVLDAQRSLFSFQDQLAQSEGAVSADLVRLYKALGGGWTPMAEVKK
jgi:multidrug efflux system outer membrane protein